MDLLARMELKDLLVTRGLRDHKDLLVLQVILDLLVILVTRGLREHKEFKDLWDLWDLLDL